MIMFVLGENSVYQTFMNCGFSDAYNPDQRLVFKSAIAEKSKYLPGTWLGFQICGCRFSDTLKSYSLKDFFMKIKGTK